VHHGYLASLHFVFKENKLKTDLDPKVAVQAVQCEPKFNSDDRLWSDSKFNINSFM